MEPRCLFPAVFTQELIHDPGLHAAARQRRSGTAAPSSFSYGRHLLIAVFDDLELASLPDRQRKPEAAFNGFIIYLFIY